MIPDLEINCKITFPLCGEREPNTPKHNRRMRQNALTLRLLK
jgi:hypothetical protein